MRRIQLERPQGPSVPGEITTGAAAAAVGDVLLRDVRGPWLLLQASSLIHVPVLLLAKLRSLTFPQEVDSSEDSLGPPLVADILDAISLRGPQEAFDGVRQPLRDG